jgi:hypothetical protein
MMDHFVSSEQGLSEIDVDLSDQMADHITIVEQHSDALATAQTK